VLAFPKPREAPATNAQRSPVLTAAQAPLQGKEVVSSSPANAHLSAQVLTNDASPSGGKYLMLCGEAGESEASEGLRKAVKYEY